MFQIVGSAVIAVGLERYEVVERSEESIVQKNYNDSTEKLECFTNEEYLY